MRLFVLLAIAFLFPRPAGAANPLGLQDLKARDGKPFEYMKAADDLPNYTPNAQWGTQGEPIRTMQKPLPAEESIKRMVTPPGFEVSLFATEPQVVKAIWMAWDEKGRMWIASTTDYPNNMQPEGQGNDRLIIVEDTNGDGKADSFKTFADKLSVPTTFVFANGGVLVAHSGKVEFLKDTDGDDKADERRDIIKGFGTNDTHAGPSNFRNGFDNWIWGVVGYSGFNGKVGGKDIRFGQGIYRFKPDGSEMEFVRSSNNNTWGLAFTEDNIVIGSTANGNASMHMPIPNRYYERVSGFSGGVLGTIADSQNFYPITEKVRQVDYHGKFTAGAGSAIYTARAFPNEYWNVAQFVCEPTGHLLAAFKLVREGSNFRALNSRNFAASDDEWASPVCAEVGPDGALWVSDWYNYIIQHNPVPRGFQNGKGNAYETPLRDKAHGRIYRIAHTGAKAATMRRLNPKDPAELLAALRDDNLFWRQTAQRLLVDRGSKDVVPGLVALTRDKSVDALGLNVGAIHALWTLEGLGAMTGAVAKDALTHPSSAVRRAAIMTMPRGEAAPLLASLKDSDAQVRLAALLAISESAPSKEAAHAIVAILGDPQNHSDRWIPDAAIAAGAKNDVDFLRQMLNQKAIGSSIPLERILRTVAAHYAQRAPADSIAKTLAVVGDADPNQSEALLEALAQNWPRDKAPKLSGADKEELAALIDKLASPLQDRLLAVARRWDQPEIFGPKAVAILANLKKEVADTSHPDKQRVEAAQRLIRIDDSSETARALLKELSPLSTPELSGGFLSALGEGRDLGVSKEIIAAWKSFTPAAREAAIRMLLRRPEWTRDLLDAIQDKQVSRGDLRVEQWAQLKSNRQLGRRAARLQAEGGEVSADREEIVKKMLPIANEKGDPARGKEIFAANCAVCHVFDGAGGKVGPDLSGIGAKPRAEVLTDILDPNRAVEGNYRMWNVSTRDGETLSGRLNAETQTTIEILDAAGQAHVIQRKDIAKLEGLQTSVMPNGFEAIAPADMASLLAFLSSHAK